MKLGILTYSPRTREWCLSVNKDGKTWESWISGPKARASLRELAKTLRAMGPPDIYGMRVDVFTEKGEHRGAFEYDLDGHPHMLRKGV